MVHLVKILKIIFDTEDPERSYENGGHYNFPGLNTSFDTKEADFTSC
jgi:hypothetical protein